MGHRHPLSARRRPPDLDAEVDADDQTLIEGVRAGDIEAFTCLYRRHVGAVRLAASDNVHDPESLADVVQDTFARALARLPTLRDPSRFRPWLLQIARHVAVDHRRARTRVQIDGDETLELRASSDAGPGSMAELGELASLVRGCVEGLSRRDATALTMASRLGLGPTDIAAALGVTPGAAKVILHRAKKRLREAIALEVMVRSGTPSCEELAVCLGSGDLVAARVHISGCVTCQADAESEVSLYGLR